MGKSRRLCCGPRWEAVVMHPLISRLRTTARGQNWLHGTMLGKSLSSKMLIKNSLHGLKGRGGDHGSSKSGKRAGGGVQGNAGVGWCRNLRRRGGGESGGQGGYIVICPICVPVLDLSWPFLHLNLFQKCPTMRLGYLLGPWKKLLTIKVI